MKKRLAGSVAVVAGLLLASSCAEGMRAAPDDPDGDGAAGSTGVAGSASTGGAAGASGAPATGGAGGKASGGTSAGGAGAGGAGGAGATSGAAGASNPCEGVLCNKPPANECDVQNLKVFSAVGTCANGMCSYGATAQACPNGCMSGACVGDPCIGVSCNSPPASVCASASVLEVSQKPGTCKAGACSYPTVQVNCAFGCTAGQCEGDPCAGVACNQQAANYCVDADHLRVRDLPGACSAKDGTCSYTTHDEFCSFGCTNGACNNDPCVGVTCPTKPSYCSDANTAVQFGAGKCVTGLPCEYVSTPTNCPNGCMGGQCVACTVDGQCPGGQWCSGNQCAPCSTDLHCGAACSACGGATPKCNGTSCVECLTTAHCAAGQTCNGGTCAAMVGCAPPAAACTTGGSVDGGCSNPYRISRTDAGSGSGFAVNNDYGLCGRKNDFTTGSCGGSGSDAEYRLFMKKGETAAISLTRGSSTCTIGWSGTISLKIYEAACAADCSSCPTTCNTIDHCVQSNNQNIDFAAPNDGWYTIVVDSVGPVEDKGGVFHLGVKLTCAGGSCACQ